MSRSEWNRERGIAVCAGFGGDGERAAIDDAHAPGLGVGEDGVDDGEYEAQFRIEPRGVEEAKQAAGIAGVADVLGLRQRERMCSACGSASAASSSPMRRIASSCSRMATISVPWPVRATASRSRLAETYVPRL